MRTITRSEYAANLSLVPTTKRPAWMEPAPIRTQRPHHFNVLAIATRHPTLFQRLKHALTPKKPDPQVKGLTFDSESAWIDHETK